MLSVKTKISAFIALLFLSSSVGLGAAPFTGSTQAQSSAASNFCTSLGLSPGTSDHSSCTSDYDAAQATCLSQGGQGTPEWQQCVEDAARNASTETTGPGVTPGDGANRSNTAFSEGVTPDDCGDGGGIENNCIVQRIIEIINVLSAGVGIVIAGTIIASGIQYIASQGNPQLTESAINRMRNAGIALGLYIFGWALLNWLVPGGLLN